MITISQSATLTRLQKAGLLMNFMTEEQKLAVHAAWLAEQKSKAKEAELTAEITKLQNELTALKEIK